MLATLLTSGQVPTDMPISVASGHTFPYLAPVDVNCSVPPSGTGGGAEQNLAEGGGKFPFLTWLILKRMPLTFVFMRANW